MNLRNAIISVFGSSILQNISTFVIIAYFSRNLGTAALGSFFLFQSLLSMLVIPVDLGLRIGIEKRISEGEDASEILTTGLILKLSLLVASLLAIFVFRGQLNSYIGADVAVLLGVALVLNELGQVGRFTLRGEHRISESAIYNPLKTIIWGITGGVLVAFGFSEVALFWGYVAGLFVGMIITLWLIDTELGRPSFATAQSIIGYSKFAFAGNVGGFIYNWTDVILLGVFASQTAVGAYEIAWKVAAVSLVLGNAVQTSIFPSANAWGAANEYDRVENLIESAFIPSFYLVIPAAIGGVVVGGDIFSLVFSVDYPFIYIVLLLLFVEKLQRAFVLPLIAPMHAIGQVNYAAYATVLGVFVNLIVNFTLIPLYGVVGAAIGTTLGGFASVAPRTWFLSREVDINVPWGSVTWLLMAGLIMGIVLYSAKIELEPVSMTELGILIGGGAILYGGLSVVSRRIRGEVIQITDSIT
jgi:O-antigen/teichoic acid export membrane protein